VLLLLYDSTGLCSERRRTVPGQFVCACEACVVDGHGLLARNERAVVAVTENAPVHVRGSAGCVALGSVVWSAGGAGIEYLMAAGTEMHVVASPMGVVVGTLAWDSGAGAHFGGGGAVGSVGLRD
jgi:hypothetical protein